jgi:hypothetical protein
MEGSYHAFRETQKKQTQPALYYPKHPFPAQLCKSVSRFPSGFRELTLSGAFSTRFIDLLERWLPPLQNKQPAHTFLNPGGEFLDSLPLGASVERMVAVTLMAYTVWIYRPNDPAYGQQVQARKLALNGIAIRRKDEAIWQSIVQAGSKQLPAFLEDVVMWALVMLRATTDCSADHWGWAERYLRAAMATKAKLKRLGYTFLPFPEQLRLDPGMPQFSA